MEEDPGLPIKLGPCSNGEYDPEEITPIIKEVISTARADCEIGALRTGMTRREFLLSAAGTATTLLALDLITAAASSGEVGGRFLIDPQARFDSAAAEAGLAGDEFVFDLQGHLLEYDLNPATRGHWFWGSQFPQAGCGQEDDPRACFTMDHFIEEIFFRSDTTMVALSGLPLLPEGSPLPPELMAETRRVVSALGGDDRVVVNAQVLPQIAPFGSVREEMERAAAGDGVSGWKTFTHFPVGDPWWLDDHDPTLPQVGDAFIDEAARLGLPRILVHKGLSGGRRSGSPEDIGPAAARHPDVDFIVYHSGFEVGNREGPYSEDTSHLGVNRLISSLRKAGIGKGGNVYAELGTTWWNLMRRPTEAAHVLGKLVSHLGEDNVVWGTDSIFYGSPQDQIDAFRTFHITSAFQEKYGYPELTKRLKRKILGENAARIYRIEPVRGKLRFSADDLAEARRTLPGGFETYGPETPSEVRAFRAHHRGWP
jgi:predicted TIM-barrel fold metal-dependent hydrolase